MAFHLPHVIVFFTILTMIPLFGVITTMLVFVVKVGVAAWLPFTFTMLTALLIFVDGRLIGICKFLPNKVQVDVGRYELCWRDVGETAIVKDILHLIVTGLGLHAMSQMWLWIGPRGVSELRVAVSRRWENHMVHKVARWLIVVHVIMLDDGSI